MLKTLKHMDKITALHHHLKADGMLQGFDFLSNLGNTSNNATNVPTDNAEELEDEDKAVIWGKSQGESKFNVQIVARPCACKLLQRIQLLMIQTFRIWLPYLPSCPHCYASLSMV
jgi:hypothetical protein